jgi:hypothetical protein
MRPRRSLISESRYFRALPRRRAHWRVSWLRCSESGGLWRQRKESNYLCSEAMKADEPTAIVERCRAVVCWRVCQSQAARSGRLRKDAVSTRILRGLKAFEQTNYASERCPQWRTRCALSPRSLPSSNRRACSQLHIAAADAARCFPPRRRRCLTRCTCARTSWASASAP